MPVCQSRHKDGMKCRLSISPLWHSSCAYSLLWNCHFHMNGHRHCAQPSTSDSLLRVERCCVILPGAARRRCSLWISSFPTSLCPSILQLLNPKVMLMLKGKKIVMTQGMLMKPKAYNPWLCRHHRTLICDIKSEEFYKSFFASPHFFLLSIRHVLDTVAGWIFLSVVSLDCSFIITNSNLWQN